MVSTGSSCLGIFFKRPLINSFVLRNLEVELVEVLRRAALITLLVLQSPFFNDGANLTPRGDDVRARYTRCSLDFWPTREHYGQTIALALHNSGPCVCLVKSEALQCSCEYFRFSSSMQCRAQYFLSAKPIK